MSARPSWMVADPRDVFDVDPLGLDNPKINPSRAELMREVATLQAALEKIADRGTHCDTNPTRRMPVTEEAQRADTWWVQYLGRADSNVRVIAANALKDAGLRK